MYRKTFEIFSKFIGKEHNITIQFDQDHDQANADMTNNVLHLPKNIASAHAHKALALTMHEAAHIRHSKKIPIKKLCPMESDFHILNSIEDIRIDYKNFDILPNIYGFYEELVKDHLNLTKKDDGRTDHMRKLAGGIMLAEGFPVKLTKEDEKFMYDHGFSHLLRDAGNYIERNDWAGLKQAMDHIKKLLKIDPSQDKPNTQTEIGIGKGIFGQQQKQDGQGQPGDKGGQPGQGANGGQDGVKVDGQGNPWMSIGDGPKMPGGSLMANPLAMDEQCANEFKEILNIKETKIINEGSFLDTANLLSYHTGEIETLFKEDKTIRKKKSKIMFLIDASGSMQSPLLDGKSRAEVVKASIMRLTEIINEVREFEGINVDWAISQFDYNYQALTKENWQREYYPNGGTSFYRGFAGAMEDMIKDYEVEGKRIIVVFTDGDVSGRDVDEVIKMVQMNYNDIRSLMVGVGSDVRGKFVKDLVGDNVIIAQDNATDIIIQTIKAML